MTIAFPQPQPPPANLQERAARIIATQPHLVPVSTGDSNGATPVNPREVMQKFAQTPSPPKPQGAEFTHRIHDLLQ